MVHVTYQPDIMTHLMGQFAGLHCTTCGTPCSEAAPCRCCAPELYTPKFAEGGYITGLKDDGDDSVPALLSPGYVIPAGSADYVTGYPAGEPEGDVQPEVEASAEPQAEVMFITDDDAGAAGESVG